MRNDEGEGMRVQEYTEEGGLVKISVSWIDAWKCKLDSYPVKNNKTQDSITAVYLSSL